jgi:hypothetical protein
MTSWFPNPDALLGGHKHLSSFCIGIGCAIAIRASMSQAKFDALAEYRASRVFTDA